MQPAHRLKALVTVTTIIGPMCRHKYRERGNLGSYVDEDGTASSAEPSSDCNLPRERGLSGEIR
jgi:hypothetical protein